MKTIPRVISSLFLVIFPSFLPDRKKKNLNILLCVSTAAVEIRATTCQGVGRSGGRRSDLQQLLISALRSLRQILEGLFVQTTPGAETWCFTPQSIFRDQIYTFFIFLCFYPSIINIILYKVTHVSVPSVQLLARLHPGKQAWCWLCTRCLRAEAAAPGCSDPWAPSSGSTNQFTVSELMMS